MDVGIVTVGIESGRGVAMLRVRAALEVGMVMFGVGKLGMVRLGALLRLGMLMILGVLILGTESVEFGDVGVGKPVTFRDGRPEGRWEVPRDIREVDNDRLSARGIGVGKCSAERLGVKIGALKLTIEVGNGNPSDGGRVEEMLNPEGQVVGFDMLILREGIVKDGIARD